MYDYEYVSLEVARIINCRTILKRIKMKIYISLPISGYDIKDVEARCEYAKEKIKAKGHEPVSPLDLCNGDYSKPYSYYIGVDMQAILECDAVLFLDGYKNSKGCTLELAAAQIYGKKRFFEDDF